MPNPCPGEDRQAIAILPGFQADLHVLTVQEKAGVECSVFSHEIGTEQHACTDYIVGPDCFQGNTAPNATGPKIAGCPDKREPSPQGLDDVRFLGLEQRRPADHYFGVLAHKIDQDGERIRRDPGVVVQDPDVFRTLLKSLGNPHIVARRITKVLTETNKGNVGNRGPGMKVTLNLRNRIIAGMVVYQPNVGREAHREERIQALKRVLVVVPIQNDNRYGWELIIIHHCNAFSNQPSPPI